MKKYLSLLLLTSILVIGYEAKTVAYAPEVIEATQEATTATLTLTYIEQWDIPSGLFKWYRGAIELDNGDKFEILPTYFSPYSFLYKGNTIEYYQIEDLVFILRDPVTGRQIQATPFEHISPLSHNYGRTRETYYFDR